MFFLALAMALHPQPTAYCELAEINHCHDAAGNLQFVQLIAWDWDHQHSRWNCQDWLIVSDWARTASGVAVDTPQGETIRVRCKFYRETWTNHDVERQNQQVFPATERRKVFTQR